jgi:hypothetical protein
MTVRRVVPALLGAMSALAVVPPARAAEVQSDEIDECIAAAERGQHLRGDKKYSSAAAQFSRCQRSTCPALIQEDCTRWSSQLAARTPTVIVRGEDAEGRPVDQLTVTIDGAAVTRSAGDTRWALDPGVHVITCAAAGYQPGRQQVELHDGERDRVVTVRLAARSASGAPEQEAGSPLAAVAPSPPEPARHGGLHLPPLATLVLGGVAVASFATEAVFGMTGISQHDSDVGPGGCAPHCTQAERSSIQTKFAVADVSLGLGAVATALATVFWLTDHRSAPAPAPSGATDRVAPVAGGGIAALTARF